MIVIALPFLFWSCNKPQDGVQSEVAAAAVGSEMGVDADSETKISKSSEMRFRVKDVQESKMQIGSLIQARGGYLVESSTESMIMETDKVPYSLDSLLELSSYRINGLVVAKVPASELDAFTDQIVKKAVFVDFQSIRMDDLTAEYRTSRRKSALQQKAVSKLDSVGKTANGIARNLEIAERKIDEEEANRVINQRVALSTITLNFYQDNKVQRVVIANDQLASHQPPFLNRLGLNMVEGWGIFKEVILFIGQLWLILIVAIVLGIVYRKYKNRTK